LTALDVLVVAPAPSDDASCDGQRAWQDLTQGAQPFVARSALKLERLQPSSESGLKRRLAEGSFSIVHFVGRGTSRSAQYGTLTLEDAAGRSRNVNVNALAALLKPHAALRVVVLQACQEGEDPLAPIADALVALGVPAVISTSRLERQALACFLQAFYGELLAGATGEQSIERARDSLVRGGYAAVRVSLRSQTANWLLQDRDAVEHAAPATEALRASSRLNETADSIVDPVRDAKAARAAAEERLAQELARKRAAGEFDVFLCHNGADKPAVKRIAQKLMASGVMPWLDEWELPPGRPWQPLLEQQISKIRSAAVFVGAAGVGPWQEQELYGFLREFVSRQNPVIPVLLENAPDTPALPIFLKAMTWVDFRLSDPDPLERLIWGITGRRSAL
jgi:TIR domain/CHAT domain